MENIINNLNGVIYDKVEYTVAKWDKEKNSMNYLKAGLSRVVKLIYCAVQ